MRLWSKVSQLQQFISRVKDGVKMPDDYKCSYCGIDAGGFHGCRAEVRHVIERYFSDSDVLDVDELTNLIGSLGYY